MCDSKIAIFSFVHSQNRMKCNLFIKLSHIEILYAIYQCFFFVCVCVFFYLWFVFGKNNVTMTFNCITIHFTQNRNKNVECTHTHTHTKHTVQQNTTHFYFFFTFSLTNIPTHKSENNSINNLSLCLIVCFNCTLFFCKYNIYSDFKSKKQ